MNPNLDEVLALLSATPGVLEAWLSHLPEALLHADEGPGTWSPFHVVGHLIHGEKTDWISRMNIILTSEDKRFAPFDRLAQFRDSEGKSMEALLKEFRELRERNLAILRSTVLEEKTMLATGIHPELGTVTLGQLLSTWATHDMSHLAQIARVLAKHYQDAVGPWKAYLSVLNR